jgi:predicted Zn-dependent peptidase
MKRYFLLFAALIFAGAALAQPKASGSAFQLPAYEQYKMSNGLTVYLMEQHEVPLVYVNLVFRAGSSQDGDKSGLASLTAEALKYGTTNYTKDLIEETVDFLGAQLYTGATNESANVYSYFNVREQDRVWGILGEMAMQPSFDSGEFEKGKVRKLAALKQAKESPRSVIDAYWNKFIYGDHPYSLPQDGDQTGVEKVKVEDLKAFHQEYYQPHQAAIAVVGDFKIADMKKRLDKLFEDWTSSTTRKINILPPVTLDFKQSKVLLVNKNDSRETRFYIGGKGVPRKNADYVGIQVVNTILGGRFTSWLNAELRINSGLSYGARSTFIPQRLSGTFYISSFTKTSTTVEAIDLALQVLDKLHKEGPDSETLESAKNYLKGGFPTDYETSGQLAALLTDFYLYGFDEAYINDFQKQVDALDLKRAREIIAKYFPKENLQFVLIGKAEDIRDGVRKYGKIEQKEINGAGY